MSIVFDGYEYGDDAFDTESVEMEAERPAKGKAYLARHPQPGDVPEGRLLIHNFVMPSYPIGLNGFRIWHDKPRKRYKLCGCGWAESMGEHFMVERP